MNEIQVFNNTEFGDIRTIEQDGKVLFCGADVAIALGYADAPKAIKSHCKEDGWAFYPVIDSMGRTQQAKFITEGNLYRLISHSKLPTAEKFESWVFDEVLPTIRRTGSYQPPQMTPMEMIAGIANGCVELEKRTAQLEQRQTELEHKLAEDREAYVMAAFEFGRIGALQRAEIQKAVKVRAIDLCEYAETYDKIGKRVINCIYKGLQKKFNVPSYIDLQHQHYTDALIFVQCWQPDAKLCEAITKHFPKVKFDLFGMLADV